jgi:hypothetical protein
VEQMGFGRGCGSNLVAVRIAPKITMNMMNMMRKKTPETRGNCFAGCVSGAFANDSCEKQAER